MPKSPRHLTEYAIVLAASPAPAWGYSVHWQEDPESEGEFIGSGTCSDYDSACRAAFKVMQEDRKKYGS